MLQTYTTPISPEVSGVTPLGNKMESWDYSAITTMVFQSAQDSDAFWKDPEYQAIVKEDAAFMVQGGKMTVAIGNEEVLVDRR